MFHSASDNLIITLISFSASIFFDTSVSSKFACYYVFYFTETQMHIAVRVNIVRCNVELVIIFKFEL